MKATTLLARQFASLYNAAGANLKGMTHEDSLVQPSPGGNCANWILGHLVNVHNGVMALAGADPVWESEQLARAGFDPIENPENAIDWDTLVEKFLGSRARCLEAIERLPDESLDEAVPDPFGGETTRGALLGVLETHQWYHVGQLGFVRRTAGHAGAILAPGQTRT